MSDAGVIRPLPADVIKKIAAGEIIVRPSSAIKELIENSIDAGATEIRINMSANPLDFCEIIDNGCGVNEKDLRIICRRYTTSKTRDSIDGVKSLGFRGEALSSLSQSAHVTISSRTENESRRTVLRYLECEPLLDEISYEEGPRGFTLKYENLFYNYETRHKSLLSSSNFEFNSCLQLVQKYSVNFPSIRFIFNKLNSNVMQLNSVSATQPNTQYNRGTSTLNSSNPSSVQSKQLYEDTNSFDYRVDNDYYFFSKLYKNSSGLTSDPLIQEYISNVDRNCLSNLELVKESIKNIYGLNVARILHEIVVNKFDDLFFNCKGLISHPNQNSKVDLFILYINNRLVDLPQLKNLVINTYNDISNNKYRRFIYLSIFVPYDRIDANIHPSKKKIMIESQSEIIMEITNKLADKLNELMKVTNPVTTACSNTNKLITEYHITKESISAKFKSRVSAKQTNISHYVTPLFSSTSGTSAPTLTFFDNVKRERNTQQNENNDLNTNDSRTGSMKIIRLNPPVQSGMDLDLYKKASDSEESDSDNREHTITVTSSLIGSNRDTKKQNLVDPSRRESEVNVALSQRDDATLRSETPEPPQSSSNDELDDDDEELSDKNIIEKYDFNVLKIKYMNKINNFSYSKILTKERLGNLYSVKEVQELIDKIIESKDEQLTSVVLNSSYVGMVDKTYILVHHKKDLIMLNIFSISKECCYQSIIWRLNNLPSFKLNIEVPLRKLLSHSITKYHSRVDVDDLINPKYIKILNILFGFHIKDLIVYKIPDVLNGYFPGAEYLSDLFYSIFSIEYSTLSDFVVKIAKFISYHYLQPPVNISPDNDCDCDYENFACRVLFASCQRFSDLSVPKEFNNNCSFIKLANINLLHKIFERC